ncbi:MAG TPA: choice-of-anchor B family protein [Thermoanaerobaculia bacterium]
MNDSPTLGRKQAGVLAAAVLALVLALPGSLAWAHDESPDAIESHLHGLVEGGAITEAQHATIEALYFRGHLVQLVSWLDAQETAGRISADTHLYLNALLELTAPDVASAPAPADYTGNVTLLGQINPQPPNPYYSDNTSTGQLYNGIWGYAAGAREYALQSNSFGLHIIDVTDPAPFRVQFIDMSGGVSPPKGRIWRDADIHQDPVSGKTYAYVGAQSNGNLWIVDLSYLSDSAPQGVDSNPIPPAAIADRGRTNYGHTVFVNDGLLFMNTANNGSTLGCQIFDLLQDPFNPPIIASWSGSGRDCHDTVARTNVPGSGGKDLLYSSEGYATRYRILDITTIRSDGTPTLLGETAPVAGIYAHSDWLTDDSHYLYTFEEFNVYDVGVYDVSNPASPTQVKTFQWSGDASQNSRTHNGQVRGSYLLLGYYEAGFRVFDISNPVNPVEVGKYETWRDPDGDGTFNQSITGNYNGAWDVHVFLPSGNVLVSDMKSGTFIFQVDPIAPPGATSGLAATPGNGQVGLTWTAASGATGYGVHRGTTSGGPYTTVKTNVVGTSFTDTGLTNGTTYYYVVSGTNAEGEGASSNQASATPAAPSGPVTVTFTSIAAQDGWVLESSETSSAGGSINANAATASALRAGDDNKDKQYKAVVGFDTSAIPDGATLVSATLRLRRGTVSGTNPSPPTAPAGPTSTPAASRARRRSRRATSRPRRPPSRRRASRTPRRTERGRKATSTPRASRPSTRRGRRSSASTSLSTTTTTPATTTSATTPATTRARPTARSSW